MCLNILNKNDILCLIYSLEQLKIGDILQDAFKLTADLPEIETQVYAYYSCVHTHYSHSDNSQIYIQNM